MSFQLMLLLSFSIVPAAIVGLFRFTRTDNTYNPIIYCVWLASMNEIVSAVVLLKGHSNAFNNNIYFLAEALLILWQFRRWGLFIHYQSLYYVILILLPLCWLFQNHPWQNIHQYYPYFRVGYSFGIVILSILTINRLIVYYNHSLFKNPSFIICGGFCIYFTCMIFLEIFLFYGLGNSPVFQDAINKTGTYINVLSNIFYLTALLWIPPKPQYIMQ